MKNFLSKATQSLVLMLLFVSLALALTANKVYAMPSAPGQILITQPDGSQFEAQTWGDEAASGVETLEGYSINQQADGWWTYRLPDQSNDRTTLSSVEGLRVAVDAPPTVELHLEHNFVLNNKASLPNSPATDIENLSLIASDEAALSSNTLAAAVTLTQNVGTHPVLVILGYFDDTPYKSSPAEFQSRIFGSTDSVRDYYSQASYGLLNLAPASESSGSPNDGIVGWVNLGKTHPNPSNVDWDATLTIAVSAINAANPFVDYSSFDKDGNKALSASELHIVVIVAGYEASYSASGSQPAVWGHKWSLGTPVIADGTTVGSPSVKGSYTMFGEMMGDHPSTIGIIVHEMGHDLSWPDLYGASGAGLGTWDIMAFGGWNTAPGDSYLGQTPPLPNAYLRKMNGWIDPNNPAQLVPALAYQNTPIDLSISTVNPFALILPADPNPSLSSGEFFIVEHREQRGYDASLPGSGALVWHINESVLSNSDALNPRIKLLQADGVDHLLTAANYGDPGDAFSASSINKRFGVGTPLSSAFADGTPSNISVVFGGGYLSGFAPMMGPQSIGVTSSQEAAQYLPFSIYLPLTRR